MGLYVQSFRNTENIFLRMTKLGSNLHPSVEPWFYLFAALMKIICTCIFRSLYTTRED